MMPWHIYILADPRDAGVIRYVGVTNEPERRAREHVTRVQRGEDRTHCGRWKKKLIDVGLRPVFVVVESGEGGGWEEAEIRWIRHFRAIFGEKLCNLTDGGKGARGHECSEQTRRLLREAHLGLKASSEARANMRKAQLGRRASADTCTKMSRSHQGTLKTSSHRAHISAAMLGNQNGLSRKDSEEVRARRNAAVKAAWARRKVAQGVPDACALFKEA